MARKVDGLQSNAVREMSLVFKDYEGEISDVVLAIKVVRFALEAQENNRAERGTARIALDHLEEMAAEPQAKMVRRLRSLV